MQVLVTGGTGFIGRCLCERLQRDGHEVSVLTRQSSPPPMPGVRFIAALAQAGAVDAVVNLAGESLADRRWSAARKQRLRDSRIGTTAALLDWMRSLPQPPGVLVSGSAIGYYGPRDATVLDETAAAGDDFAAVLCRDWEAQALQARALGVRTCLLRTGIVLERDGGALARMLPPFRMGMGGPMGSGQQWMSWIHRDDLVSLILWLLCTERASGPYNGTAPQPQHNAGFARTLGAVLNRPAGLTLPAFALRLAFGEMSGLLLTGQNVHPVRALQQGFQFRYPTLEQALQAIVGRHA